MITTVYIYKKIKLKCYIENKYIYILAWSFIDAVFKDFYHCSFGSF